MLHRRGFSLYCSRRAACYPHAVQQTTPAESPGFPRPLQGRSGTVGVTATTPVMFLVLFGLVFAVVGGGVLGVSLGWIPTEDSSFHGSRWVVGCVGAVFMGAGLGVMGMALRFPVRRWVLARNRRLFPNQPALWDHPWNPRGEAQNRAGKLAQSLLAALGITLFLVPFNWWAFFSGDDTWMVKIIVGLFDLILVACWWGMFHTLVWAVKYGPAWLRWDSFPVRRDAVLLRWEPGRGLRGWDAGVFTLRCVRERVQSAQERNGTESQQLHECLWEEERRLDGKSAVFGSRELGLAFTLPAEAPGTSLSAEQPVYWELEVHISQPGVDFVHRYLVPIYS